MIRISLVPPPSAEISDSVSPFGWDLSSCGPGGRAVCSLPVADTLGVLNRFSVGPFFSGSITDFVVRRCLDDLVVADRVQCEGC
jgi:hypothetical protein